MTETLRRRNSLGPRHFPRQQLKTPHNFCTLPYISQSMGNRKETNCKKEKEQALFKIASQRSTMNENEVDRKLNEGFQMKCEVHRSILDLEVQTLTRYCFYSQTTAEVAPKHTSLIPDRMHCVEILDGRNI